VTGVGYQEGELACDGLPLAGIARGSGTPVHVYSGACVAERFRAFDAPFAALPHRIHYALKANSTLALVALLRSLGASADANSGGEIALARRAGFAPADIVFTGVGKTNAELEQAVTMGVAAINVESPGEIARLADIAGRAGREARVAVRVNPDIDAGTHPHIATGSRVNKFGVSVDEARALARGASTHPGLRVVGLHVHVGSQITRAEPLARAAALVADLARELQSAGLPLEHLDVGGGLGIRYRAGQPALSPEEYAAAILPAIVPTGLTLLLEPGRWIVGPAGVLVTEVVDLKRRPDGGWFVVVDAGMTDLMRPALYGAWHDIEPVRPRPGAPLRADVVGPVCETADAFGTDRELPPVEPGDLLAIRDTGAYGAVMASNYNRRPMAAEVLVQDGEARLIRRRQTIEEMLQWDVPW
jgi:diaminopimelate decarboxylase